MASDTKRFDGVPGSATFEAAQNAVREIGLKIGSESVASRQITAKSKMSMKSFGQTIDIKVTEIGAASELRVTTSSGQLSDWGEGDSIVFNIISTVAQKIDQMRRNGAFEDTKPIVHQFAPATPDAPQPFMHNAPPAPPQVQAAAPIPGTPLNNDGGRSFGSWALRIAGAGFLFWIFVTPSGKQFVKEILASASVETDIAKYDCKKVADLVTGEKLQNIFGGRFEIIKVTNPYETVKDQDKITCRGDVHLSNGQVQEMRMVVEKAGDNQILYRVEPTAF